MQTTEITTAQTQAKPTASVKKGKGLAPEGTPGDFLKTLEQALGQTDGQDGQDAKAAAAHGLPALLMALVAPQSNQPADPASAGTESADASQQTLPADSSAALQAQGMIGLLQAGRNAAASLTTAIAAVQNAGNGTQTGIGDSRQGPEAGNQLTQPSMTQALQTPAGRTTRMPEAAQSAPAFDAVPQNTRADQSPQAMTAQSAASPEEPADLAQAQNSRAADPAGGLAKVLQSGETQVLHVVRQGAESGADSGANSGANTSDTGGQPSEASAKGWQSVFGAQTGKTRPAAQQGTDTWQSTAQSAYQTVQSGATLHSALSTGTKADTAAAANVASQVSASVEQAVKAGHSELRLHLSPEELGGISVKIISHEGALTLQITAENQHTGSLIAGSINDLSSALSDKGLSLSRAEVLMSSADNGNTPFSADAGGRFSQQGGEQGNRQSGQPAWVPAMEQATPSIVNAAEDEGQISIVA